MASSKLRVEGYYKDFDNLIEYAEGAQPQNNGNTNYDTQLVFGDGYSATVPSSSSRSAPAR